MLETFRSQPVKFLVQSFRLNQFPAPLRRFWAENYQPYRGSIFVLGRRLEGASGEEHGFELIIVIFDIAGLSGARGVRVRSGPCAGARSGTRPGRAWRRAR